MKTTLYEKWFFSTILLGIITLIACAIMASMQYNRIFSAYNNLIESYQTIRAANQSLISITEAALDVSTFLQTKDQETLKKIPQNIIAAQINFIALKQLTSDNRKQTKLMITLTPLFENKIAFLNQIIHEYSAGHIQQAILISSDKNRLKLTNTITQLIIAIKQDEIQQLDAAHLALTRNIISTDRIIPILGILGGFFIVMGFVILNKLFKSNKCGHG